jgi:hypothetical protein
MNIQGIYSIPWTNFIEEEDKERTYKGRTVRRDKHNSRYWCVDGIRFTIFKMVMEYLDT